MAIKKYLDWKSWWLGFYLSWIKTVSNTFLMFAASNGAEKLGIPSIGLNLMQALSLFGWLTVIEIFKYLNAKPKPETVTENTETQFIEKQ